MSHSLAAKDEQSPRGESHAREEQLLFRARKVLVFGEIDDKQASAVCRRLLALAEESDAPITVLISSPGGHVESGDAIHDMMRLRRRNAGSACPIRAS